MDRPNEAEVERARRLLLADGRFRVLERVALPARRVSLGPMAGSRIGICLDTETTGLDPANVRASGAHYDRKDVLRRRGYFWNGASGEWMREVADELLDDEREWLRLEVYSPEHRPRGAGPIIDRVDAGSRYRRVQ